MSLENVCVHFKYGYCKYKTKCRLNHVEEECKNKSCSENCDKRHPKACFYWVKFGNCKIGKNCAYKHEKNGDIEKLEMKIEEINKKISEMGNVIENKFNDLLEKIKEKDQIIEGLVKDVSKIKTQIENEKDIENGEDETNDDDDYDDATVERKAKEFCMKNLKHLDDLEKDIRRSRKNFKDKAKVFTDKMYDEIDNFGIYPGDYTRHHNCTFEVFEMQYALKKMDANNEKEKILKLIEFIRGNFKLVYEDKSRLYE